MMDLGKTLPRFDHRDQDVPPSRASSLLFENGLEPAPAD